MKKKAQVVNLGLDNDTALTAPVAAPAAPAAGPEQVPAAPQAGGINLGLDVENKPAQPVSQVGDVNAPVTNVQYTPDKKQVARKPDSHPFSQLVNEMQNKMLSVSNNIKKSLPQLIPGSDTYDKESAFLLDPTIIEKINNISSKKNSAGGTYGDGLWGQRTQDALNNLYVYAQTLAHTLTPNDPSLNGLLTEFNKIAAPGKKYTDVKNYNEASKQAMVVLDKLDEMTGKFAEYIKTNKSVNPNQQANQSAQPGQNGALPNLPAQPGQTAQVPGQQANQQSGGVGQPVAQQNQGNPQLQNVKLTQEVNDVKSTLQRVSKTGELTFPFDTATNQIDFARFSEFLIETNGLLYNAGFIEQVRTSYQLLRNGYNQVFKSIGNWNQVAAGTDGVDGGFSLTVNDNVNEFVRDKAGNDYGKARSMLNILSGLCLNLSNMVNSLKASPGLVGIYGEDVFNSQYRTGYEYADRIKNMIAQIDHDVARK